jgi:hypothetical protein
MGSQKPCNFFGSRDAASFGWSACSVGAAKFGKQCSRKAADDHSVAMIVMAQRDRLRARCEALEAERDSFKRELLGHEDASESLKADNTKLFEKV